MLDDAPLPTVHADESSSTGENLLDPAQPVYAVGAILVDSTTATALVAHVRAALSPAAGEPKYTKAANSAAGRDALVDALAALPAGAARVYLAHKRYMVAAKMVDLLIEPLADATGYDMYADGSAPALANLLHLVGPILGDADAYERMLAAFVAALRGRAKATLNDLFDAIDTYLGTCDVLWRGTIAMLAASRGAAGSHDALVRARVLRDSLDPAVPCLVSLCRDLGERVDRFRIVHDESNVLARHALDLLRVDRLPDLTRPGRRLDPLPAVDIAFGDSATHPQLHVADWISGAARQWGTSLVADHVDDPFAVRLEPVVRPWLAGGLWPDPDAIGAGPGGEGSDTTG